MGGRGPRRRRGRRGGGGGGQHPVALPMKRGRDTTSARAAPPRADYISVQERKSLAFEEYYAAQEIVPPEDFSSLLAALAQPLPTAFRVAAGSRFRDDIVTKLTTDFPALFESARKIFTATSTGESSVPVSVHGDEPLLAPERLPWYPDGLGWTVSTPRTLVRRDNALAPFHKWLVGMNELGAINRQEAVSMVPPLLLDLRPGQSVLDMCAAPGSKTAQLLEALSSSPPDPNALSGSGLVVANDADIKRCWLLAHQVKRFSAPNFIVTHHDAQAFPAVTSFDRVLCDVPCTGDGTLRKAPDMWRKWTPQLGNGIHRLQKNILRRGIELLKPGGRLVYSTCSMNPVENEAIIADALRHFGPDVIQLIDVSNDLPLLKRRPGIRLWKVKDTRSAEETADDGAQTTAETSKAADNIVDTSLGIPSGYRPAIGNAVPEVDAPTAKTDAQESDPTRSAACCPRPSNDSKAWFESFDDVPERRRRQLHRSHFPPTAAELGSGHFPLERCVRLVPSDQDTGAFFVAVLAKSEKPRKGKDVSSVANNPADAIPSTAVNGKVDDIVGDISGHDAADGVAKVLSVSSGAVPADEVSGGVLEGIGKGKQVKDGNGNQKGMHSRLITDDPLVGLERVNREDVSKLASFFGLDETRCRACLMTRGSEAATYKKVLVVSPTVRELLTKSIGSKEGEAAGVRGRLRVVNAGVRVFERTGRRDATVPFRVLSEGVGVLRRTMTKRNVSISADDLKMIVEQEVTSIDDVPSTSARTRLRNMEPGSAFLVMGEGSTAEVIHVWLGSYKISKVMPVDELEAICTRHGLKRGRTEGKPAKLDKSGKGDGSGKHIEVASAGGADDRSAAVAGSAK